MFGGGRRRRTRHPAEAYRGLRQLIFELDPARAGMRPTAALPAVWGAVMDLSYPGVSATLVALADATTSLYTSTGGGILGAGEHAPVARASAVLLGTVEEHLPLMPPSDDTSLPAPGYVVLRALTYDGRRAVTATEAELGRGQHPLSAVFFAAHEVISEIRRLDQARPGR